MGRAAALPPLGVRIQLNVGIQQKLVAPPRDLAGVTGNYRWVQGVSRVPRRTKTSVRRGTSISVAKEMFGKLAFKVLHTYNPALCVNACNILAEPHGAGRSAVPRLVRREAWGASQRLGGAVAYLGGSHR